MIFIWLLLGVGFGWCCCFCVFVFVCCVGFGGEFVLCCLVVVWWVLLLGMLFCLLVCGDYFVVLCLLFVCCWAIGCFVFVLVDCVCFGLNVGVFVMGFVVHSLWCCCYSKDCLFAGWWCCFGLVVYMIGLFCVGCCVVVIWFGCWFVGGVGLGLVVLFGYSWCVGYWGGVG